jgi:hypothetical protein
VICLYSTHCSFDHTAREIQHTRQKAFVSDYCSAAEASSSQRNVMPSWRDLCSPGLPFLPRPMHSIAPKINSECTSLSNSIPVYPKTGNGAIHHMLSLAKLALPSLPSHAFHLSQSRFVRHAYLSGRAVPQRSLESPPSNTTPSMLVLMLGSEEFNKKLYILVRA